MGDKRVGTKTGLGTVLYIAYCENSGNQ
jgi:hypothetical protein